MDANKFRMAPKDTMAKWEWTCGGGQWRRLLSKIWGWVGAETLVSGEGSIRKARNNQAKVPLCVWEEGGGWSMNQTVQRVCWLLAGGGRQPLTRTGLSAQEGPSWRGVGGSLKAAFCVPTPPGSPGSRAWLTPQPSGKAGPWTQPSY